MPSRCVRRKQISKRTQRRISLNGLYVSLNLHKITFCSRKNTRELPMRSIRTLNATPKWRFIRMDTVVFRWIWLNGDAANIKTLCLLVCHNVDQKRRKFAASVLFETKLVSVAYTRIDCMLIWQFFLSPLSVIGLPQGDVSKFRVCFPNLRGTRHNWRRGRQPHYETDSPFSVFIPQINFNRLGIQFTYGTTAVPLIPRYGSSFHRKVDYNCTCSNSG